MTGAGCLSTTPTWPQVFSAVVIVAAALHYAVAARAVLALSPAPAAARPRPW